MIDATNRNTALASALVEELARCGVPAPFLSPGSRSSPIALALDREPAIELARDRRRAQRRLRSPRRGPGTGMPAAIVACTSGSAAANLHPAVVEADQAGVPLIVLTSDRPPELRGIGAGQTIEQIGLYGTRHAGSARSGPTRPTTPGCCTCVRPAAGRSPRRRAGAGPST